MSAATGPDPAAARADRRVALWIFVLAAAVFAAIARGYVDNMDSAIQFTTARQLVEHGTWSLRGTDWEHHRYAIPAKDGECYMPYGPGAAFLHVPALLAGRALAPLVGIDPVRAATTVTSMLSPLAAAATLATLYLLSRRLGLAVRDALLTAFLHGFATYALQYARSTYYETVMGCLLALAAAAPLLRPGSARALLLGGVCFAAALSMKVAHGVLVPAYAALLFVRPARAWLRDVVWFLLPSALVLAAVAGLGWARHGSPFELGYGRWAAFTTSIGEGLWRNTFAARGGWFVFSPVLLLALPGVVTTWRARPQLAAFAVLSVLATMLLASAYIEPEGGTAYGARYLVPVTWAASLAAGLFLARTRGLLRAACAALLGASVVLQLPSTVLAHQDYWQVRDAHRPEERDRLPPPVVANWILAGEKLRGRDRPWDLSCLGVAEPGRTYMPEGPTTLPGVNTWWARASLHYGHPRAPLLLIPLGLAAAFAAWRLVLAVGGTRVAGGAVHA